MQNKNIITMVILILTMVLPWYTTPKNHGNSYHGTPWYYHGTVPWYTMVAYHGVPPQKTMVMYHGIFSVGRGLSIRLHKRLFLQADIRACYTQQEAQ